MVRVVGVGIAVADGGDEGDGMMLMEVVTKMVTRVEWQRGGDGEARGGACVGGSGRSGDEVHFWSWPEYSPENFSDGGWPEKVAAGGGCQIERGREGCVD
ncbi:hypothetical protein Tco_0041354 [Tanacetum coccineum]